LNENIFFAFKAEDFDNVYKFSGQEMLETDYKGRNILYYIYYLLDYKYDLNVNQFGIEYNIMMKINVMKYETLFQSKFIY